MKIGVISDTHGCLTTWENVYQQYFSNADFIIHAGDVLYHGPRNAIPAEYSPAMLAEALNGCPVPLVVAGGNCDADVDGMVLHMPIQSPYTYVIVDGLRIVTTHGHLLTETEKKVIAKKYQADIFITGHTHVAALEQEDGVTYLNPGSPAMSKRLDKIGTVALIENQSVVVLDIATGNKLFSAVLD